MSQVSIYQTQPFGPNRSMRRQLERSHTKIQRREEKKLQKNAPNGSKYNSKKSHKIVPLKPSASFKKPLITSQAKNNKTDTPINEISEETEVIGEIEVAPQVVTVTRDVITENTTLDLEKMNEDDNQSSTQDDGSQEPKTVSSEIVASSQISLESKIHDDPYECATVATTATEDETLLTAGSICDTNQVPNKQMKDTSSQEDSDASTISENITPTPSCSSEKKKSKTSLFKLFNHKNLSKLSIKAMTPSTTEEPKKTTEKKKGKVKTWKKLLKKL
ncbi:uncharacterized protein B0P05DRAFT_540484 [Gilbertella persicaria]|uniref:uncharacterized protein n=1 Tax=Gilbertella persicaria TaxID=101096 RepID=UPI00221F6751|nr:uncharacterized protein B0P05DRAFT_540484 [Gilbertella persicaria]KAI8080229.1 hypothetical protein B0P05DRAFT_540484 [Gilbertella persicaria]